MFEIVTPISGTIHSVGPSTFDNYHSKWSTISIMKDDGSMSIHRNIETRDVMTPEIRAGYSGTFYFWSNYAVAVRHHDGRLIDACFASASTVRTRQIFYSILGVFFIFGIFTLPYFIFFGASPARVKEQVLAHARSLDQAA